MLLPGDVAFLKARFVDFSLRRRLLPSLRFVAPRSTSASRSSKRLRETPRLKATSSGDGIGVVILTE
jgi:hypothetical protein